ncbi:TetR/AcrR family transcriptional regulator [Novosphingobium sp. Gsoil 351]|uniref:TetR/AcrR family transcriptional regulator n=1 Tax=Novosphingobium sp. Gsoil 351 TaxID=2675225 RepID=UPI001E384E5A|nr:TetR/AcrR family transcriptional regulator [Novosphingobium sp. Gsoil 351]
MREAANEIRAKGPDGVAVAGLMARAGLTHGGFYAHFASKDALVAEAVGTMFDDARRRSDMLDGGDDPRAALRDYLEFYLSTAHRDGRDRGCPLPALSGDIARTSGPARNRFAKGVVGLSSRLAGLLTSIGVDQPESEGNALLAQLVGAVSLARALGDRPESLAVLEDTKSRIIARFELDRT